MLMLYSKLVCQFKKRAVFEFNNIYCHPVIGLIFNNLYQIRVGTDSFSNGFLYFSFATYIK